MAEATVTMFSATFSNPDDPPDYDDGAPTALFPTFADAVAYLLVVAEGCVETEREGGPEGHLRSLIDVTLALVTAPGPDLHLTGGGLEWWITPVETNPAWTAAFNEWLAAERAARPEPSEEAPF